MKRSSAITSLCLCGAVAAAFALTRGHEVTAAPGGDALAREAAAPLLGDAPRESTTARAPAPRDLRAQVAEAVEQAALHVDPTSLDDYLATLEARARTQGRVTALEVEPGMEMIQRHDPTGERLLQFNRRMQALQHELAPEHEPAAPSAPAEQRLATLRASIVASESEAERQTAVRSYLETARELSPDGEGEALALLNRLVKPADDATEVE